MPQVAVTDFTFPNLDIESEILTSAGCEVVSGQGGTPGELSELVAEADAVITQFAPIDAEVVQAMTKALVIVRYGVGFDNVDCAAAKGRGIPVCNIPDYCIDEVADHTLAFMLGCTRNLRPNCAHIVRGNWGLPVPLGQMRSLSDQTVGVIGLGRIGRAVVERLRPFRPTVLACDPVASPAATAELGCRLTDLQELLSASDIVTLHCPSTAETRQLIDAAALATMKPASILINVGRGDLVDLAALTEALKSGQLAAAALDVFDPEPVPHDSELLAMDNVLVSSHVASASTRAVRQLRESAASLALSGIRGEPLRNIVNGL